MWVILSEDGQCVVRGKTRKTLCTLGEETKKELVAYDTQAKAKAALMRMLVDLSDDAQRIYQGQAPRLRITETAEPV